jgi:phosphate starvation-inducible protein PhoH
MATKQRRLSRREKRRQERDSDHMLNILNTKFGMRQIKPLTPAQSELFDSYKQGYNLAAIGTAGTGKTMCATYLALQDVLEKGEYEKIVIVRSAVQTREQGFVPGTLQQKEAIFEQPYIDIVNDLFGRGDAYQILKQKGVIRFTTSSNIRGLTFDNSVIIVDECQNMTYEEIRTIMTRVGELSRIMFCGDTKQDDLRNSKNRLDRSGLANFIKVIKEINEFDTIEFTVDDIVRSGIVKSFIIAEEKVLEYA